MTPSDVSALYDFLKFVLGLAGFVLAVTVLVYFFRAVAFLERIARATESIATHALQGKKALTGT